MVFGWMKNGIKKWATGALAKQIDIDLDMLRAMPAEGYEEIAYMLSRNDLMFCSHLSYLQGNISAIQTAREQVDDATSAGLMHYMKACQTGSDVSATQASMWLVGELQRAQKHDRFEIAGAFVPYLCTARCLTSPELFSRGREYWTILMRECYAVHIHEIDERLCPVAYAPESELNSFGIKKIRIETTAASFGLFSMD